MNQNSEGAIGGTPLVRVEGIYAKLECANPCGSIKDRMVCYILQESERSGRLRPGMRVVEATSGNTGIALAFFAGRRGYRVTIVMPEDMTEERRRVLRGLGAELVLCSAEGSFAEAVALRDELAARRGVFCPDQFSNPLNTECHRRTTGREILQQLPGPIGALVAGVGTGGSLIGVAQALKGVHPSLHVAAVEPAESPVMSGGKPGPHGIPGIGDGFLPALASDGRGGLHPLIDEVLCVSSEEAREAARYLETAHGLCVGISSGANFLAARRLARRFAPVVTLFPDGYSRYRSRGLRRCRRGRCPHEGRRQNPLLALER